MLRLIAVLIVLMAETAAAQPAAGPDPSSGFLTDYSILQPSVEGQVGQFIYIAPDAATRLAAINAVFIEQPALAIAPDSKVSALSPSDSTVVADTFKTLLVDQLAPSYIMAVQAYPGVLTLRVALTNVHLQNPRRRLLSFTPLGIVTHAIRQATDSVMQKIDLTEAVIQAELIDDNTGQMLVEVYDQRGSIASSQQFTDWQQVETAMTVDAKRLSCNIGNAHVPPGARTNCWTITATTP